VTGCPSSMDYDVVIIGAGMSGLAAGIRLAHYDRRVCILERHTRVGGLNSYYRRGGYDFDAGLHAMTNIVPASRRTAPLNRLLRQLRIPYDALDLCPQRHSVIEFPAATLRFSNDLSELTESIAAAFPGQVEGFRRLVAEVESCDAFALTGDDVSAASRVAACVSDPVLADMLMCPVLYYGGACEGDMPFRQFCIMFRSIFMEGLGRPVGGIRPLLERLAERLEECGGELRLGTGVARVLTKEGAVTGVELASGERLATAAVLSSAGYVETLSMCDPVPAGTSALPAGQIAFAESISVLDCDPVAFGLDATVMFTVSRGGLRFRRPAGLLDEDGALLCVPGNFVFPEGRRPGEHVVRLARLTDYRPWFQADEQDYRQMKQQVLDSLAVTLERRAPGIGSHVVFQDLLNPRTVQRFTGHLNGAVYGSPVKHFHGRTPVTGLSVCGTDQGLLGIVGALMSGVSVVNRHYFSS